MLAYPNGANTMIASRNLPRKTAVLCLAIGAVLASFAQAI